MKSLDKEIELALQLSSKHTDDYSKYSNIYPWTNENLEGTFGMLCKPNSKVLTCNGSGDHPLNAIFYGSTDITTFDINQFSLYYLDLKIAALLSFSREDFLKYMPGIFDEIDFVLNVYNRGMIHNVFQDSENLRKILPILQERQKIQREQQEDLFSSLVFLENLKNIDKKSYDFWTKLYKKRSDITESFLFKTHSCGTKDDIIFNNNYLKSDENYQLVKNKLPSVNIKRIAVPIKKLPSKIKKEQFDFIHFSNIANNPHVAFSPILIPLELGMIKYSYFIEKNIYKMLRTGGTIVLNRLQEPSLDLFSKRIDYSMQRAFHERNLDIDMLDLENKERVYYKKI